MSNRAAIRQYRNGYLYGSSVLYRNIPRELLTATIEKHGNKLGAYNAGFVAALIDIKNNTTTEV